MRGHLAFRQVGIGFGVIAASVVVAAWSGCGGDESSDTDASASGLTEQLVDAGEIGLESEREFEWDNPTDFVTQGVFFAQETAPSELIGEVEEAGFQSAAGAALKDEKGEVFAFVGVAAFDSEEGAADGLATFHAEDLKPPCFGACVVAPAERAAKGIPDSASVHQVPSKSKPPPGLFPFEGFLTEFRVGNKVYLFQMSGPPGLSEDDYDADLKAVYEHVSASQ